MLYRPREPALSELKQAKRLAFPVAISYPLCGFIGCRLSAKQVAEALGPPHLTDEIDGAGTGDLWAYEFACGLKLFVQIPHAAYHPGEIVMDSPEISHALRHLPFHESDLVPMSPQARAEICKAIIDRYPQRRAEIESLHAFQVWRIDDNGNVFAVGEPTSEGDARCLVAQFEARGHKQTYWVERAKRAWPLLAGNSYLAFFCRLNCSSLRWRSRLSALVRTLAPTTSGGRQP